MNKYEITWIETGYTTIMTTKQVQKEFGKDEWEEIRQGYLPHIVAVQIN